MLFDKGLKGFLKAVYWWWPVRFWFKVKEYAKIRERIETNRQTRIKAGDNRAIS